MLLYYCTLTIDVSINMQPKLVNWKEMLKVLAETSRGIGCNIKYCFAKKLQSTKTHSSYRHFACIRSEIFDLAMKTDSSYSSKENSELYQSMD